MSCKMPRHKKSLLKNSIVQKKVDIEVFVKSLHFGTKNHKKQLIWNVENFFSYRHFKTRYFPMHPSSSHSCRMLCVQWKIKKRYKLLFPSSITSAKYWRQLFWAKKLVSDEFCVSKQYAPESRNIRGSFPCVHYFSLLCGFTTADQSV